MPIVAVPAMTASTCPRNAWNSSRSASLEMSRVRPPSDARPSTVLTMFAITYGRRSSSARAARPSSPYADSSGTVRRPGNSSSISTDLGAVRTGEGKCEETLGVGIDVQQLESGAPVLVREPVLRELARDLGLDVLALVEGDVELECLDAGLVRVTRVEAHLDPLTLLVVDRAMIEPLRVEIPFEVRVDHVQHVAIELRRDAGGVVVRRLQALAVLHEVGAHQQAVFGAELVPHATEHR